GVASGLGDERRDAGGDQPDQSDDDGGADPDHQSIHRIEAFVHFVEALIHAIEALIRATEARFRLQSQVTYLAFDAIPPLVDDINAAIAPVKALFQPLVGPVLRHRLHDARP